MNHTRDCNSASTNVERTRNTIMNILIKPSVKAFCAALLMAFGLATAQAGNVIKADNANVLTDPAAWVGVVAPTTSDVATWDTTVQINTTSTLGADASWQGIKILDPLGPITISSGNTITLGAAGVDLSFATNSLTLANSNILGASQTWSVTNDLTLTASGGISGPSMTLTKTGNGTLIVSGASTYSGGTVNNGGVLQTSGGTSLGTGAITNNNGTTFRPNTTTTLANAFNFNGNVTIDLNNVAGNQGIGSPGAISGSGTVTFVNQNTGNRTFTLGGSSSSMANFSGTMILGTNNGTFRFNDGGGSGNTGSSSAIFDLGTGSVTFLSRNRGAAVNMGALFGGPGTRIVQGSSSSGISTYTIGAKNIPCEFDGTISDGGTAAGVAITKTGTNIFILTGTNSNVGATTVNGGTLQVGNGTGVAKLGTGAVINNATLVYNCAGNFSLTNPISGSGAFIHEGGGILVYSGTNSSSGTLTVSNNGTVALDASGFILGPLFLAGGTSFDISTNPAFVFNQTVSGFGSIVGAATSSGGAISPGGLNAAGTLTFSNGLSETGNVTHQMELSSPGGTNDLINIIGNFTVSGTNPIIITKFGGGTPANGLYPLFAYSGTFNGALSSFSVSVAGVTATVTNPPNQIALIISPAARGATNLTWLGDGVANNWDVGTSNWVNGATSYAFQAGDSVRFDSTGAANNTVNISAANLLLPAGVVVDAPNDYTFAGSGVIGGTAGLVKTNAGTLVVQTTNSYVGPTIVGKGVLEITSIANGNSPSAIGAANSNPTNLVLVDSTLRYTGLSGSTDRGATLNGTGATLEVPGGDLTFTTTSITGPGALIKSGAGTLTLNVPNSYVGGTIISNGVLALGANVANFDGASGSALGATNNPVTFYGGTLQLFGYNGNTANNYSTLHNPLIVPAGQTGTLRLWSRGPSNSGGNSGLRSSLSGAGTFNLVVNYVRDNVDGDWSAFTGTINVTSRNAAGDEFRINNNFGYANAAIYLNGALTMDTTLSSGQRINIGELGGINTAIIGAGNLTQPNPTWVVGWKNTTNTFAGTIADDGATSIAKVGTGTWILTGANSYSGSTIISNGVLQIGDGVIDGSINNSANIDINAGAILDVSKLSTGTIFLNGNQVLHGNGSLYGILDTTPGGTVSGGGGINGATGTLTVTNHINLGGTTWMKLNRGSAPNSDRLVAPAINLGGTLVITNIGAPLHTGDTFTLLSGALINNFSTIIVPNYYTFDTTQLPVNGTVTVTSYSPPTMAADFSAFSSGTITFNASNGIPSNAVSVLSTTNLALPIVNWTTAATGNFDGSGNFSAPVTVDTTIPRQFYVLSAQ
jgi:fibronectin-binding autotransporter adhesin